MLHQISEMIFHICTVTWKNFTKSIEVAYIYFEHYT